MKAVNVLWDVAQALLRGCVPPEWYNAARFCPIPKVASFRTEDGSLWHLPKDTRPISVVNADNRMVANLFRSPLAKIAAGVVHPSQRGFVDGRVMLDNVLELDDYMREVFFKHSGALFFLDVVAAFPSLSHDYLWSTLHGMGMPSDWLGAMKSFYVRNDHILKDSEGNKKVVFTVGSGVRQCCSFSLVHFALVLDPFIRCLVDRLGS